jgi:hypothetical protein
MVGHQHVRMEVTVLAVQGFAQPTKVGVAIFVIEETGTAIVTALYDMQRYTGDVDARAPRHGGSLAEFEPGPFSPGWRWA